VEGEADAAPPDVADVLGEVAAPPPADELAAPHADSATAASNAPDSRAARDARNDLFMKSPSAVDRSLRLWRRHNSARG
jgi:hypothetical protein